MVIENINQFIKENDIGTIFLDIDGVVLASCQALVDLINEKHGTNFSGEQVTTWNFDNLIPNITSEEVEELFSNKRFFTKVDFISGSINFIREHKDNIIFITKSQLQNYYGKKVLFMLELGEVPIIPLPLYVSKSIINMDNHNGKPSLFIDDSTKNLLETNANFKIQFREYNDGKNEEREWIKDWNGDIMYNW